MDEEFTEAPPTASAASPLALEAARHAREVEGWHSAWETMRQQNALLQQAELRRYCDLQRRTFELNELRTLRAREQAEQQRAIEARDRAIEEERIALREACMQFRSVLKGLQSCIEAFEQVPVDGCVQGRAHAIRTFTAAMLPVPVQARKRDHRRQSI
jgi:DNA repair ATPase RecN